MSKLNTGWPGVVERYRDYLPVTETTPVVTLLEGNTPLIPAPRLAAALGGGIELFLKYEALNPTCSFKDRGMTMAMTKAKERGARVVVCASTGNTSASAAAYATRGGMKAVVILPHGKIALGKLAQALVYGARIIPIDGNFDQALDLVRALGERDDVEVVNSINPFRIEGQKTAAFEICDVLGRAPDFHFIPVGNAGNITAYWKGFTEYHQKGEIASLPRMMGWQAAGAAPIVDGRVVDHPETVATAIRIGNPASWKQAEAAARDSGGKIDKVTDEEILEAYRMVAACEGVFVEPACAAPLAGLKKALAAGWIPKGSVVTATMTGHGLKDPDTAIQLAGQKLTPVPPDVASVLEAVERF
ncbi:MAG: threonine synthase [Candidatus Methylacidiphilales bacterium]